MLNKDYKPNYQQFCFFVFCLKLIKKECAYNFCETKQKPQQIWKIYSILYVIVLRTSWSSRVLPGYTEPSKQTR